MDIRRPTQGADYIPEEDVTETLPDGRTIQVAVKGTPVPYQEAVKLGLVKEGQQAGPSERKPAQGPSEAKEEAAPKEEAPAKNEGKK